MIDPAAQSDAMIAPPLSAAGLARRDAMLAELRGEVVRAAMRRRRRRALTYVAGATLGVAAIAITIAIAVRAPVATPPGPSPLANGGPSAGANAEVSLPPIQLVRNDPSRTVNWIVRNADVDMSTVRIDDAELLRDLAEAGRPTGLVRSQGRVWCTEPVTDAERSALRTPSG